MYLLSISAMRASAEPRLAPAVLGKRVETGLDDFLDCKNGLVEGGVVAEHGPIGKPSLQNLVGQFPRHLRVEETYDRRRFSLNFVPHSRVSSICDCSM